MSQNAFQGPEETWAVLVCGALELGSGNLFSEESGCEYFHLQKSGRLSQMFSSASSTGKQP